MKAIRNRWIPVKGFKAINLCGVLFVKQGARMSECDMNHEVIHSAQIKELLYVFFYVWYVVEWLIRLFMAGNAYRNISFEREAYAKQTDLGYLAERKRFAFLRHLRGDGRVFARSTRSR